MDTRGKIGVGLVLAFIGGAAGAVVLSRAKPRTALRSARRMFRIGDLPRDMREELFNEHAMSVNPDATERGFFTKRVPTGTIAITDLEVDAYPAAQVASYTSDLPPIVIADGRLLDGGHRITAARARGETHLRYIDVSGLIDTDSMGFISKLPSNVVLDGVKVLPPAREDIEDMADRKPFFAGLAKQMNTAACKSIKAGESPSPRKAYLSDVMERLGTTVPRLANRLAGMQNLGLVELVRADLPRGMDAAKLDRSELQVGESTYHLLVADDC